MNDNAIVNILESNLTSNTLSIHELRDKVNGFSNWLNSTARLSLHKLQAESDRQEAIYLILRLKKDLKYALHEMNNFNRQETFNYQCSECQVPFELDYKNIQLNRHIEIGISNFIINTADSAKMILDDNKNHSQVDEEDEEDESQSREEDSESLNNFRFNFELPAECCDDDNNQNALMDETTTNTNSSNIAKLQLLVNDEQALLDLLYPDELCDAVARVDRLQHYSFQQIGPRVGKCLLCCCNRLGVASVLSHANGQRHLNNALSRTCLDAMLIYHECFKNLPVNYKAHQIFFNAKSPLMLLCIVCNESIKFTRVQHHINSAKHNNVFCDLFKLATGCDADNNNGYFLEAMMMCVQGAGAAGPDLEVEGHTTSKMNGAIPRVPLPSIPPAQQQQPPPIEPLLKYDAAVIRKIYPKELMDRISKYDKTKLYTFQRSGDKLSQCLVCKCTMGATSNKEVISHVKGKRHNSFVQDGQCLERLQKYHQGFLRFNKNYQAHQIYFKINGNLKTYSYTCILCDAHYLPFSNVKKHIDSGEHKRNCLELCHSNRHGLYLLDLQLACYGIEYEVEESEDEADGDADDGGGESGEEDEENGKTHQFVKAYANEDDLLPNRLKRHMEFLSRLEEDSIFCELCSESIPVVDEGDWREVSVSHVLTKKHSELAKMRRPRIRIFCDFCNIMVYSEANWFKHFKEPNNHINIPEGRRANATEQECITCRMVLYGDTLTLLRHVETIKQLKVERKKKRTVVVLPAAVKKLLESEAAIQKEGDLLCDAANQVLDLKETESICCTAIETALSKRFEGCKAHPFGSRVSGLSNKNSDLDIFIDVGDMYTGNRCQGTEEQKKFVKIATAELRKCKTFCDIRPIPMARTPIVKIYHRPTNLDCDLSFRHGLSVENTKYIKFCWEIQPIVQPMILLIKQWSNLVKLNEHMSAYAFAMLAIFYLQVENHLLSVEQLREINQLEQQCENAETSQPQLIDGWETINYLVPLDKLRKQVQEHKGSLQNLLAGFFKYYGMFDYKNHVICPLLGRLVERQLFLEPPNGQRLPTQMTTYIKKLEQEDSEQFRAKSVMCIQDPFDLSHNLTKAVSQRIHGKFQRLCVLTYQQLHKD